MDFKFALDACAFKLGRVRELELAPFSILSANTLPLITT